MLKKVLIVISLFVLFVSMSGCLNNTPSTDNEASSVVLTTPQELIVVKDLPSGFEYLGAPSMSVEAVQSEYVATAGIISAAEGLYKYSDKIDFNIDVIEMDNTTAAQNFISQYKSGFNELPAGDRFTEESFNGHSSTIIKKYAVFGGQDVPRYVYIWNNDNFVFVVSGATDDSALLRTFVESTGY
jgi:hypothetical protein